MGVAGRKPKPEDQRRNRVKSPFEWRDILNRPFTDPPPLPPFPGRPRGTKAPEPRRPLDTAGRGLWDEVWRTGGTELIDPSALLQLCELMDERIALRERVLSDGEWRERSALRVLDAQLAAGLAVLSTKGVRTPHAWPQATRRWWAAVSTMAHCSIWADADWQYAIDTASVAAAFHSGDLRCATELRNREKVMGTTADARRDLRIRYVEATENKAASSSVVAMDAYRAALTEGTDDGGS